MIRKQILFAATAVCGVLTSPLVAQVKEPKAKKQSAADVVGQWSTHAFLTKDSKCSNCHTGNTDQLLSAWTVEGSKAPGDWSLNPGAASLTTSGVTLSQVDETTRAILSLPAKAGIAVTGICPTENKNLAGLQKHDIVLTINDKPASDVATVEQSLAGSGEVALVVLRNGKKQELKRAKPKPKKDAVVQRYLLGVSLGDLDPVVRTQLGLDETVTVFIQNVTKDGAAEAAGVKQHDVVLKINEKPADSTATVQAVVKDSKGEPVRLLLLRDGEQKDFKVKPKLTETTTSLTPDPLLQLHYGHLYYMDEVAPEFYHALFGGSNHTWGANANTLQALGLDAAFIAEYAQPATTAEKLAAIEKKLDELTDIIKSLKAAK